jgi:AcrR family transcriptional regulator
MPQPSPTTERREAILRHARKLFADRGFQATTMDDVATAAGFTKPILYQHFRSKDALYTELLGTIAERLLDRLQEAVDAATSERGLVEAAFRVYFDMVTNESDSFKLLFLQPQVSEEGSPTRAVEAQLLSFVEPLIPDNLEASHRQQLAGAVVGLAEGVALVWLIEQEASGWPPVSAEEGAQLAQRTATLAWGGLRSVHPDPR